MTNDAHGPTLAVLEEQFPCFRIWREETCDRALYVARSLHLELNPYTVVTDDISELSAALEPARFLVCPRPHPAGTSQLTDTEPAGLAAQMEQAERAAASRRARSPGAAARA